MWAEESQRAGVGQLVSAQRITKLKGFISRRCGKRNGQQAEARLSDLHRNNRAKTLEQKQETGCDSDPGARILTDLDH